jgi:excisionase family DNA binding protein
MTPSEVKVMERSEKISLTIQEASRISGLSVPYLYALSARGELPVSKVGTRVLILRDELEIWLRSKIRKGVTSIAPGSQK